MGTGRINNPESWSYVSKDLENFTLVVDASAEENGRRPSFTFRLGEHDNVRLIALVDRSQPSDRWYLTVDDTHLYTGNPSDPSSVGWHRNNGTVCVYFYREKRQHNSALTIADMQQFHGVDGLKRALRNIYGGGKSIVKSDWFTTFLRLFGISRGPQNV